MKVALIILIISIITTGVRKIINRIPPRILHKIVEWAMTFMIISMLLASILIII